MIKILHLKDNWWYTLSIENISDLKSAIEHCDECSKYRKGEMWDDLMKLVNQIPYPAIDY